VSSATALCGVFIWVDHVAYVAQGSSHSGRGARPPCLSAKTSWCCMSSVLIHRCWPRVRPMKKPSSTSSGLVKCVCSCSHKASSAMEESQIMALV
jgi:hypothetical protein